MSRLAEGIWSLEVANDADGGRFFADNKVNSEGINVDPLILSGERTCTRHSAAFTIC